MKITILTDKTSWFNAYNPSLKKQLEELGFKVALINSKEQIGSGDIVFFLSCFEIIKEDKLRLNKHNIVVHESALPKGRGWSPATWQILENKNIIPITLFEADTKADAGVIYIKDKIKLCGTELVEEWRAKIALKTIDLCLRFALMYKENKLIGLKQKGSPTYYRKRTPCDSELNINKTIAAQFNCLRVADNDRYPAFFNYKGKKFLLKIEVAPSALQHGSVAGEISFSNILDVDARLQQKVFQYRNNPEASRHFFTQKITPAQHKQWLKSLKGNESKKYIICFLDGRPAAMLSVCDINKAAKTAGAGLYLFDLKKHSGSGLILAAVAFSLDAIFNNWGIETMHIEVLKSNRRALNFNKFMGYQIYGETQLHGADVYLLRLTKERWQKNRYNVLNIIDGAYTLKGEFK